MAYIKGLRAKKVIFWSQKDTIRHAQAGGSRIWPSGVFVDEALEGYWSKMASNAEGLRLFFDPVPVVTLESKMASNFGRITAVGNA